MEAFWILQVVIAKWLARWLATGEVLGSNPGMGENVIKQQTSNLKYITFPLKEGLLHLRQATPNWEF